MGFEKTIVIVGPTASGKSGVAVDIASALAGGGGAGAPAPSSDSSALADARFVRRISNTSHSNASAALNNLEDDRGVRGQRLVSSGDYLESNSRVRREELSFSGDYLKSNSRILGAEIISADSRAIYEEMDIGTAKPTREERQGIPHWGIDLVEPGERFTVADFKAYAEQKIDEIKARGKIPIVVGGTGLYVDALVYDYNFTQEAKRSQEDRKEVCTNYLLIGVKTEPEILRERIAERVNKMFTQELFEETKKLVQKYGWDSQAMKSNIYQFAWGYLQGEYSLEEAKQLNIFDDWHLAKRQLTWFKRNKKIKWMPLAEIRDFVIKCIQDEQRI